LVEEEAACRSGRSVIGDGVLRRRRFRPEQQSPSTERPVVGAESRCRIRILDDAADVSRFLGLALPSRLVGHDLALNRHTFDYHWIGSDAVKLGGDGFGLLHSASWGTLWVRRGKARVSDSHPRDLATGSVKAQSAGSW
jgi:hypothetical protein